MGGIRKDKEGEENRKLVGRVHFLTLGYFFCCASVVLRLGLALFLSNVKGQLISVTSPFLVAGLQVRKTAAVLSLPLCSQPYLHLWVLVCGSEHLPLCWLPVPMTQL